MMIHIDSIISIGGKKFECLEIQDGDGRYFQIQKSPCLCNTHVPVFKINKSSEHTSETIS